MALSLGDAPSEDRDEVTQAADRFRDANKSAVLVLFSAAGRGAIHVAVTDDLVQRGKKAGDLVNRIAALSGGKGGGRPAFASASAGDVSQLDAARQGTARVVGEWLAS